MSLDNPPSYYFNGINFNSSFFGDTENSGLSTNEANLLYLRKTIPDTAVALQTFTAGININNSNLTVNNGSVSSLVVNTTSLGSQAEGGGLDIGASQTTGTLNIGNLATRTGDINISTTKNTTSAQQINIGSSNALATGQIIRMNRPLTIGYSAIDHLQYTTTRIGSYLTNASTEAVIVNTNLNGTTLTNFSNIPAGLYMFEYQINYRITVANTIFTKQNFILSTTFNDFLTANIIEEQFTALFKTSSETITLSSPVNEYSHKFSKAGVFVLSALSDVYLNYRIVHNATTTVPYIIGSLRLVRIG